MRSKVFYIVFAAILLLPLAMAQAVSNKITPVIDDQNFESNFQKGVLERVALNDGRVVELYQDFTWGYARKGAAVQASQDAPEPPVPAANLPKTAAEAVTVWDTDFKWVDGSPEEVQLYIHFHNKTNLKVVGVHMLVTMTNAFGNVMGEMDVDDDVAIEPNQRMRNDVYYRWRNDPRDHSDYQKLWLAAKNGTAKVAVQIRKVVFEDGTVLTNVRGGKKK